jgi:hypothetical protein
VKWLLIFVTLGLLLVVASAFAQEVSLVDEQEEAIVPIKDIELIVPEPELAPNIISIPEMGPKIPPVKEIKVFLPSQILIAYENDVEVYRTRVSTGATWGWKGKTTKYHEVYTVLAKDSRGVKSRSTTSEYDVLTPWKFRLCLENGHLVNIHEYPHVPLVPASRGCIREPWGTGKWLYDWVVPLKTIVKILLEKAPEKLKLVK